MNTAIIVAAGIGSRFGSDKPKQFVELLGKPLIVHTLERFEACSAIDRIVLVLSPDVVEGFGFHDIFSKLKSVVPGGDTRARSVLFGLEAAAGSDIVAVHDGARPLVSVEEIEQVVRKAAESGAACLVGEVSDTIKHVESGEIVRTVERTKLRRALTPQAFRYDILKRAFAEADLDAGVTDECYLVEKLGVPIACVEGSARNIKITRPEDLLIAQALLSQEAATKANN